jgi:hypothetical protein
VKKRFGRPSYRQEEEAMTIRRIEPKSKPRPQTPTTTVNGMAVFGLRPGIRTAA